MSNIKFSNGWYMPAKDRLLEGHMKSKNLFYKERIMWQKGLINHLWEEISESKCRVAIDVGSHIGTWTYFLADKFNFVHCFEPLKIHQDCWKKNVEEYENAELYPVALGYKEEKVKMFLPNEASVAAHIEGYGAPTSYTDQIEFNDIKVCSLDSFNFSNVDFIKIDVEGYELNVVKGAKQTILRNKPYILVEDHGIKTPIVKYLEDLGMSLIFKLKVDFLMGYGTKNISGNSLSQNIVGGKRL